MNQIDYDKMMDAVRAVLPVKMIKHGIPAIEGSKITLINLLHMRLTDDLKSLFYQPEWDIEIDKERKRRHLNRMPPGANPDKWRLK